LRLLSAGNDPDKTLALRRYILGLSLVAFTSNAATYLRQGCNLVPSEKPREFNLVHSDGTREPQSLKPTDVLKFATAAAKDFGVGEGREVTFDSKLAQADIKGEGDTKQTRKKAAKKAAPAAPTAPAPAAPAAKTALSPQAAWPFPTGNKP
jgi:CRISPR-associated protein Csb1